MALVKVVNGEQVAMTSAEESAHTSRPVPTPAAVSRAQLKLALHQTARLQAARTFITGADEPSKIDWADRSQFRRGDDLIQRLQSALSMTPTQVDDLFRLAHTL